MRKTDSMKKQSLAPLHRQLQELNEQISNCDFLSESVSSAPVGWHIEHSLLVIDGVIESLSKSDPTQFKSSFNLKKKIIYLLGKFPKGKAKAPKYVRPKEESTSQDALLEHIQQTTRALPSLSELDNKAHFKHPIFGFLALNDAIRFLEMHTEHHLKINREILAAR